MDNDVLQYNKYIAFFNSIYNYIVTEKEKDVTEFENYKKEIKILKKIHIVTKKELDERFKDNHIRSEVFNQLHTFMDEECQIDEFISFGSLWQFCQFVRYVEKVIFYKNDLDCGFYVDSELYDLNERQFRVNKDSKVDIYFKLEKTKDKINNQEFKVITLNIKRMYGKKMVNVFTIVNEDVKLSDSSDLYLINTINGFLYEEMIDTLDIIIRNLLKIHGIY